MRADEMKDGTCGIIEAIITSNKKKKQFFYQGIYQGRTICLIQASPMKDPLLFEVEGTYFSIRKQDAHTIVIKQRR